MPPRTTEHAADQADPVLPQEVVRQILSAFPRVQLIYVIAKLGIADLLRDGPRYADELASASGADAQALHRVLRAVVSLGVFTEQEDGRFALNTAGELLQEGKGLRGPAIGAGDKHWPVWGALFHAVKTGETAFDHAFGMGYFDYMEQRSGEARSLQRNLASSAVETAPALLAAYDFSPFRKIVDVGGGWGALLAAVLKAHPHLTGVLFDTPPTVARAQHEIEAAGVAQRCELVGGDFFDGVPGGGDAYLLAWVLHDWNDERAGRLLKNCRRAMPAHAPLLILETVMPPRAEYLDEATRQSGAPNFLNDVSMMLNTGGRERTEAEYRDLLAAAGLHLTRIVPTAFRRHVSVIEAVTVRAE